MKSNVFLPFERNRFYSGKLLTSDDFEAEQSYMNSKRRFSNRMLYGSGIACGLGVYNLDDLSLMIESGAAFDEFGREIVVEKSVVKKLSAIAGFDTLTGSRARLCIEYAEQSVHPAYSIEGADTGKEYEFNRISENYRLFLTDESGEAAEPEMHPEFMILRTLYADSDFSVQISLPSIASSGGGIRLLFEVKKLSDQGRSFSLDAKIQIPSFTGEHGEKELRVLFDTLLLEQGKSVRQFHTLYAAPDVCLHTTVILKSAYVRLAVDGFDVKMPEDLILPVEIVSDSPEDIVAEQLGRIPLEQRLGANLSSHIRLCRLELMRADSAYIIEKVILPDPGSYLRCTAQYRLEKDCLSYYTPARQTVSALSLAPQTQEAPALPAQSGQELLFSTGVCEIPIGVQAHAGSIFYSDEVMHELGRGCVYVECGLEFLRHEQPESGTDCCVVYGDTRLFAKQMEGALPRVNCAVNVMQGRGTFIAAVELLEPTNLISVKLRWNAIKFREQDAHGASFKFNDGRIIAVPSTIVLSTKESFCLDIRFQNLKPATLHYELTEPDSGDITPDGVYTAPSREGVYEIRISCSDMPFVSTYAYAVVKKKGYEG